MQNTWLVITPPLLVLLLSFTTHRIVFSLFCGIISATLIFHDFSIAPALKTAGLRLWETTQLGNLVSWEKFTSSNNLFIYLFLIILGIIITIISTTGATQAYVKFVRTKLHNRIAAETSSLILSLSFFIDDYLNALMTGTVMPPVTDQFKIPRIKLAFFANTFAAALCIIVPFSTWAAFILQALQSSGVSPDGLIAVTPLNLFMHAIPFAFYSFIVIATTFFLVRKNISFGPMYKHESIAQTTGNLYGGKQPPRQEATSTQQVSMFDFVFPIVLLVFSVFIGFFLTNFVAQPALFIGGSLTLVIILPYFSLRKKLALSNIGTVIKEGFNLMRSSLTVLTLAWTFGEILSTNLLTGQYIATKFIGSISLPFFPCLIFMVTAVMTLMIGSAWGTICIMIPLAIPMATSLYQITPPLTLDMIPMVIPVLSAVLAGAVAGNTFSPIADIVIMASTSTHSNHMDHVKAQQAYIAPIFIATAISFLLSGFLISYPVYINIPIALGAGIGTACIMLLLLNKRD